MLLGLLGLRFCLGAFHYLLLLVLGKAHFRWCISSSLDSCKEKRWQRHLLIFSLAPSLPCDPFWCLQFHSWEEGRRNGFVSRFRNIGYKKYYFCILSDSLGAKNPSIAYISKESPRKIKMKIRMGWAWQIPHWIPLCSLLLRFQMISTLTSRSPHIFVSCINRVLTHVSGLVALWASPILLLSSCC